MDAAIVFCFSTVAAGTVLQGAALDIPVLDGKARCQVCAAEFVKEIVFALCPCGSSRFVFTQGEELKIKSLEIEERGAELQ